MTISWTKEVADASKVFQTITTAFASDMKADRLMVLAGTVLEQSVEIVHVHFSENVYKDDALFERSLQISFYKRIVSRTNDLQYSLRTLRALDMLVPEKHSEKDNRI